jgi:hypothetical protein
MTSDARTRCPFLVPVVADRLWLYPVSAYCRRPDARLRVPAPATLAQTCANPRHASCPGYRAASARQPEA